MFKTLINAFKNKDIRMKIWMTLILVLLYRIGCYTPVPGFETSVLSDSITSDSFMGIMNAITGGSLANGTLFALGITPYINASIIMQLLAMVIPSLERLSKEGEAGKKKMNKITRYFTMVLALVQSLGIVLSWTDIINGELLFGSTFLVGAAVVIMLVAGSALVMWLGERITEYGIGNGTSLIIFIGILSTAGQAIFNAMSAVGSDISFLWTLLIFLALVIIIFALIVWIDLSERKIPIQYAKQVKGNKMYGGQNTHIPIRVSGSGVLPIIFASAFLMFPQMIASFWPDSPFYKFWGTYLGSGTIIYAIALPLLIIFFAFFYAQVQFNPEDVAKNIQQYGGFIPGIRPGKSSSDYLRKINNRITFFGALFLALIAFVPSVIFASIGADQLGLNSAFTATGMLIIVSVGLEFNKQLESQLMMRHYRGFLK